MKSECVVALEFKGNSRE